MIVLAMAWVLPANAETDKTPKGGAILTQEEVNPLRKRMPSRNFLQLSYSDGMLNLTSYTYEGEFSIQLENIKTRESVVVPSIFVGESIYIELPCGIYNVTVSGSDSLSFYGCLEIS